MALREQERKAYANQINEKLKQFGEYRFVDSRDTPELLTKLPKTIIGYQIGYIKSNFLEKTVEISIIDSVVNSKEPLAIITLFDVVHFLHSEFVYGFEYIMFGEEWIYQYVICMELGLEFEDYFMLLGYGKGGIGGLKVICKDISIEIKG